MKLVSFIYWICHLENGIINSQAEFSKFDSTVKKREEEGSCSPRLLCVDDVWEDTHIAHWFSRKPNCRKREVRSVGRAPWGSPQRNGARGCTCAPATEPATEGAGWLAGWPPTSWRGGGTRDFREQFVSVEEDFCGGPSCALYSIRREIVTNDIVRPT